MKNQEEKTVIPFRFPKKIIVLSVFAVLLSLAGGTIAVVRWVQTGVHSFYEALKNPLLAVIALLLFVFVLSLLIRSDYVVTKDSFICRFGVLKTTFPLSKITSVCFDMQTETTTIYMGEDYFVATLPKKYNETFVHAILKYNPNIEYSYTLSENKPPEDDTKNEP